MGYGKGSISTDSVNAHKTMAGAMDKGNFGVSPYPSRGVPHPDVKMSHDAMDDSMRMPPVKGNGGMMQGAADHGQGRGMKDHFKRDEHGVMKAKRFEGSPGDKREDRKNSKRLGMTLKTYERSPQEKADAAGQRKLDAAARAKAKKRKGK